MLSANIQAPHLISFHRTDSLFKVTEGTIVHLDLHNTVLSSTDMLSVSAVTFVMPTYIYLLLKVSFEDLQS